VGTGRGTASISPGAKGNNNTGLLTIQGSLVFGSRGSYEFQLDSDRLTADELSANGVTIGTSTRFTATDLGSSVVAPGTIFLIIDNSSATPIVGTFSNLPDAGIVNVNGSNFQASYSGGDGNDLTLTVVP
jgi:hypothetical protein